MVYTDFPSKLSEVLSEAYLDLLNSCAEIASASKHSKERSLEQLQKLTQAKARAVLVGSDEVISAINEFWSKYGKLDTEESRSSYTTIVSVMRKDLSGKSSLSPKFLFGALFGGKA